MKEILKKLREIQSKLEVPKGQKNTFGNYNYRSCEDILTALKPILKEAECSLTLSDEVVVIGERFYVKATVTLWNGYEDYIKVEALAREAETKKGMDESQITGAASSYARKYALNGLFCIDDTKDADATNTHGKEEKQPSRTFPGPKREDQPAKSRKFPGKQKPNNPNPKTMGKMQYYCANLKCGKEISEKVNKYSLEHHGAPLCMDCQKKADEIDFEKAEK
jgi:hypothetical protein